MRSARSDPPAGSDDCRRGIGWLPRQLGTNSLSPHSPDVPRCGIARQLGKRDDGGDNRQSQCGGGAVRHLPRAASNRDSAGGVGAGLRVLSGLLRRRWRDRHDRPAHVRRTVPRRQRRGGRHRPSRRPAASGSHPEGVTAPCRRTDTGVDRRRRLLHARLRRWHAPPAEPDGCASHPTPCRPVAIVRPSASDLQDLLLNEPWFLVEGLLWLALGVTSIQSSRRRPWLASAALACLVLTVLGVLSGLGVIGSFRIG